MKNAYSFHPNTGTFLGVQFAQESPLEPGIFLLPEGTTFVEPPQFFEGQQAVWLGDSWEVRDALAFEPPMPVTPIAGEPEPETTLPDPLSWNSIRIQRNQLLSQSDWTQLADVPLTQEQKNAWMTYRQVLRDIPLSFSTPEEVVWPTP